MSSSIQIGIIGGSGLYDMTELVDREERVVTTPFGDPSGPYVVATLRGRRVAFLARHGHGHRLLPSELNFRANIYGFKVLGAEWILSASAVGSLREDYKPLSALALDAATRAGASVHQGGTYVCMEGPQFSTVAESEFYRRAGFDVIGMTNLQEAKLAREAEICYTTLALVTDYDCWHPAHDSVTVAMIVANLTANAKMAQQVIAQAVERLPIARTCECARALATAIITRPDAVPAATKAKLQPIVGKYLA
jgi:5'-methylthioadenosine phosphorylase